VNEIPASNSAIPRTTPFTSEEDPPPAVSDNGELLLALFQQMMYCSFLLPITSKIIV
jgi:hypothetical protein